MLPCSPYSLIFKAALFSGTGLPYHIVNEHEEPQVFQVKNKKRSPQIPRSDLTLIFKTRDKYKPFVFRALVLNMV